METEGVRRRRRPALSCRECRRRKVRCDHSKPCAPCVRLGAKCVYTPFHGEEPAHRPGDGVGSSRESRESLESRPATVSPERTVRASPSSPSQTVIGAADKAAVAQNTSNAPIISDLLRRIQKLEESSASGPDAADNTRESLTCQPRDWGRRGWITGTPEFGTIVACYREIFEPGGRNPPFQTPQTAPLISQAADLLRKCRSCARNTKVDRSLRSSMALGSTVWTPPPRESSDEKVKLYFSSFESTHRILHAPTFWAEYQSYWEHPQSVSDDLRHKVLLAIGIGSSLCQHGDATALQRNADLVQQWINAAQTWLSGLLERERLDVTGMQVYCLVMLARQVFSTGDTAWVSMGSFIHGAMQVGLHRDPKHLPAMSVLQAELRRRLWATVLELVVQSSLASGMPPRISLDEFDTEPPSNVNDDEMDELTAVLQPHAKDTFTSTSIQLAMLDSLPTRLRITQTLNSLYPERSYPLVLALTAELTSALQSHTALFAADFSLAAPFHRNFVDYLTRRFLIPLHFPFALQSRTNQLYHPSHKISLDAALALVSTFISPEEPGAGGSSLRQMVVGSGLFRDGVRGASAVIALALISHVETQLRDGSLRRTALHRDPLKQVVRALQVLAAERIRGRGAETANVKGYMFLSKVLAQVEAMEEGVESVEVAVARAARDSLEICEGLLSGAAASSSAVVEPGLEEGEGDEDGWMEEFGFEGFGGEFAWESFFSGGGFC